MQRRSGVRKITSLIAVGIVIAACGGTAEIPAPDDGQTTAPPTTLRPDAGNPGLIVLPGPAGELPGGLMIGCRSGPSFPLAALGSIAPVALPEYEFVAAAIEPFLSSPEGAFWPQNGWHVLHATGETVLLVHVESGANPGADEVSFMTVSRTGDEWAWSGSSATDNCELQTVLPPGLSRVDWLVDPGVPIDPDATEISVLATERECASGQPMGDRLLEPDIVITDDAIYLAFAARAQDGAQTCQGNPETQVTVQLPEPIGDRPILDGLSISGFISDYLGS